MSLKKGRVIFSRSQDIFTNLAFEDLMNGKLNNSLFLWQNKPCVVIGRHQNPWMECNVELLKKCNIPLARRMSGGGTVYHDLGNLNCTFYTSRKEYDRPKNLKLVCSAIQENWPNLDIYPTERDDIELFGFKVSGTASRLLTDCAYHHLTLLVDANLSDMSNALRNTVKINSKATQSVRSKVANMSSSFAPSLNMESVIECIANKFSSECEIEEVEVGEFEGVNNHKEKISKWDWIFGASPPFSISTDLETSFGLHRLEINILKGRITDFRVEHEKIDYSFLQSIVNGCRFCPTDLELVLKGVVRQELYEIIREHLTGKI